MRGVLTPPPRIEAPVMKIPLEDRRNDGESSNQYPVNTHQPAPKTLSPIHRPIPMEAHA